MAKRSSDEYLAAILKLLDETIEENKKAAKSAGISNVPAGAGIVFADAKNIKSLGESLKLLSNAIIPIAKISEKQLESTISTIQKFGEAIKGIQIDAESIKSINMMTETIVKMNNMFSELSQNFFKTYFTFSPLKARILGRRMAKFYKIVFQKIKDLTMDETIAALEKIPDSKDFEKKIFNFSALVNIIRAIPMKDILKMWAMGLLIGPKTGRAIGGFFAAIVDSLTKNDPKGEKAEKAIGIAKSITHLIGMLTLSLVIMVALAVFAPPSKLAIGVGMLVGLLIMSWGIMRFLTSDKIKGQLKDARGAALGIAVLLGTLVISLTVLVLIAKYFTWKEILAGFAMLTTLVLIAVGLTWVLSSKKFKKQAIEAMYGVAAIMTLMLGMTLILMLNIIIGKHAKDALFGMGLVLIFAALSILLFNWLTKKLTKPKVTNGLYAVGAIILMMVAMTLVSLLTIAIGKNWKDSLIGMGLVIIFTFASIGALKILSRIKKNEVINGLIGVASIVAMIFGVSFAMQQFAKFLQMLNGVTEDNIKWGLALTGIAIGGVVAIAGTIAAVMSTGIGDGVLLAGVAGVELIALMIGSLSEAMILFTEFIKRVNKFTEEDFTSAMKRISGNPGLVSCLRQIITALDDVSGWAAIKMGIIGRSLKPVFESLSMFVDIIQKMAKMEILDHYDENGKPVYRRMTNQEFSDAATNVTDAFTYFITTLCGGLEKIENAGHVALVMNLLFPPKKQGLFGFLTGGRSGIGDIIPVISQFVDVIVKMASMTVPTEWNDQGVPIKYRRIQNDEFTQAATTVTDAFTQFLTKLSDGMQQISNASYIKYIIEQLFPTPKTVRSGFLGLSRKQVEQPGIGTVITAISAFVDILVKMATSMIPDEWDENGNPTHYREIKSTEWINAATTVTTCFTTFLKGLATSLEKDINPLGIYVLKLFSNSGIDKIAESIALIMQPILQIAAGKVQVGDEAIELNVEKLNSGVQPIIDAFVTMLTGLRDKLNEDGWKSAMNNADHVFYMMQDFSRAMAMIFSKEGKVAGGKSDGKDFLKLSDVTPEAVMKIPLLTPILVSIRDVLTEGDWKKGKQNADHAFYMIQDFSQALAMLFNEDGFVKGNASSGKQYIAIKKVTNGQINMLARIKGLVFGLAEYINTHEFNIKKAQAFAEQMSYAEKGIRSIQPFLKSTPAQLRDIAAALKELDIELVDKEKKRTEAIQSVSSNFKDMAQNIQQLNDTLNQSLNLMNQYNKLRSETSDWMQYKGAQEVADATQKVAQTTLETTEAVKQIQGTVNNGSQPDIDQLSAVIANAITASLSQWAKSTKEINVKFDDTPINLIGQATY